MKPSADFSATAVLDADTMLSAAPRSPAADGDALARAQEGDEAAFARLIRTHQRSVYGLALRSLGDPAEAEDLAQEVFLQLHRSLDRLASRDHLTHWLRRTVTHRVIDRLRRRSRMPEVVGLEAWEAAGGHAICASAPPGPGGAEEAGAQSAADPQLLQRLAAQLPAIPRLVLALRYQEDLDPADIARLLDLPVNTVKSHLKRSLARLRAQCNGRIPS